MAFPAMSCATFFTPGAATRHGPHQGAQKSTSTGTGDVLTISSNPAASASIGSSTGGNAPLQLPQLPLSGNRP
jgi:hypothetical protein